VYIESGTVLALAVDVDANVALKPGLVRLTQAHIAMANKLGSCTAPLAEGLPIERDEQFGDARLTSPRLKNLRWRNAATIQRWTTYAPDSALALSRVIECSLCGIHRRPIPHHPSLSSASWRRVRTGDAEAHLG
jgi:hypothetical protein